MADLKFGPFLRAQLFSLLKSRKITLADLADRCGIGLRTVSGRLSEGRYTLPVTVEFVEQVLEACNAKLDVLFTPILSVREVRLLRRISAGREPDSKVDRLAARGLVETREGRVVLTDEGARALEMHSQQSADETSADEEE